MQTFETVDSILDFAIEREEESFAFYADLADGASSRHIQDLFESFAREEIRHKEQLILLKKQQALLPARGRVTDLKIADYLVETKPGLVMGYQDALRLAMQREKAAFRLYSDLAELAMDEATRNAFLRLAREEAVHKLRFEIEYDEAILRES